jgi:hypothetical protein
LLSLRRQLTAVNRAAFTAAALALICIATGLATFLYDGILGDHTERIRRFWLVVGAVAFYGPGVAFGLAWWGLKNGRIWAIRVGQIGAMLQVAVALTAVISFAVIARMATPIILLGGAAWIAIDVILFLQLARAVPWVRTSTDSTHGFAVDVSDAEVIE